MAPLRRLAAMTVRVKKSSEVTSFGLSNVTEIHEQDGSVRSLVETEMTKSAIQDHALLKHADYKHSYLLVRHPTYSPYISLLSYIFATSTRIFKIMQRPAVKGITEVGSHRPKTNNSLRHFAQRSPKF